MFDKQMIRRLRRHPTEIVQPLKRWTPEELDKLQTEYWDGVGLSEMAILHQRSESAILSRLKKEHLVIPTNVKPDWK